MDSNAILKQLLLSAVSATSAVVDQLRKNLDELVVQGRLNPEDAKQFLDDIFIRIREEQGNLEDQFRKQVRIALKELEVPTQSEFEVLKARLEQLEFQVRQLQDRR
ncbi:phasin family protein [Anthocerotibacter panamensis]|uniref:phasin family protein n=1 Tax=Anthocerotibacter panamensis TaxID=2857077 RepID=UPI001C406D4A|nr:phasin family protein [Anthocerotibacter panamensis]